MVSLAAVEGVAAKLWPDYQHAVAAVPDPKKGEQLVLVSTNPDASRDALSTYAREQGIAALSVPAKVIVADEIPVLGTGKTDYRGLQKIVEGAI